MTDSAAATARRTVVLTGASRGIGHATVKRFSGEGWRIITCSRDAVPEECKRDPNRSEEHTSELQSLMRSSYAVFCLIKNNNKKSNHYSLTYEHRNSGTT